MILPDWYIDRHAPLPSSTVSNTLVNLGPECLPKTIPNLPNRIILHWHRKHRGSLAPTVWRHDNFRCISPCSVVDRVSRGWINTPGMDWASGYWIHSTVAAYWWTMDVGKRWVHIKIQALWLDLILNEIISDQIQSSLLLGIFIQNALGNVANLKNTLIPGFSMRLSRKEGGSLSQSLQAFWV